VGGGARSGKSRFALDLARKYGPPLVFLATAEPLDKEMEARIAQHRADRSPEFSTVEEPLKISDVIRSAGAGAMVVDCLTLWLSNVMLSFGRNVDADVDSVVEAVQASAASVILVTNEVGCGIIPETTLGREYCDRAGILNQRMASVADEVYWMAFGCPLRVK
jgi:adenosylcobinamide kinase/adenosylcobinamide-phosphate guanylyltransferase